MSPSFGYALREQNRPILTDPSIDAVEITFERADDPLRVDRYLGNLDFRHVSVHALKLSVASPDPPGQQYLSALKAIAEENGAETVSDHLGFTRSGHNGVEIGHFAPPPYTSAALDVTCRNVDIVQRFFGPIRFYLENIAYLFRFESKMSEADFLKGVLSRTGCGWLLDITNVYANATNFGFDAFEFIDEVLPTADSLQIHLAGGVFDDESGMYIDSHSHPIPDTVWDLLRHTSELAGDRIQTVFIERDQNFPDETGWLDEIQMARRVVGEAMSGAVLTA